MIWDTDKCLSLAQMDQLLSEHFLGVGTNNLQIHVHVQSSITICKIIATERSTIAHNLCISEGEEHPVN